MFPAKFAEKLLTITTVLMFVFPAFGFSYYVIQPTQTTTSLPLKITTTQTVNGFSKFVSSMTGLATQKLTTTTNQPPNKPLGTFRFYYEKTGWTLVSMPVSVASGVTIRGNICDPVAAIAPVGNCTQVYWYNSTSKQWHFWDYWKSDAENTLTTIDDGTAYFVNVTQIGNTVSITGTNVDPILGGGWPLMSLGWILIGWTEAFGTPMNVSEAVALIKGNWSKQTDRVFNESMAGNGEIVTLNTGSSVQASEAMQEKFKEAFSSGN